MSMSPTLRAALATVLQALDRDAALGRTVRGEMATELRAAIAAEQSADLQLQVADWMQKCFGEAIAGDAMERNHRFLEESLELAQANGATQEEAHALVRYVFARPAGDKTQEAGQALITLTALCCAAGINLQQAAHIEIARISAPEVMERIREKQKSKPAMSPLPGVYPERTAMASEE